MFRTLQSYVKQFRGEPIWADGLEWVNSISLDMSLDWVVD
jgi:hypothetical protein